MIEFIEIENFRGIAKGRIEGFTQINVFVGKNNSGKSTILEALAIVLHPRFLPEIIKRRGWYGEDTVLSIFRFKDLSRNINININKKNLIIKLGVPRTRESEFLIKSYYFSEPLIMLDCNVVENQRTTINFRCYFDPMGKHHIYIDRELLNHSKIIFIDYNSIYEKGPLEAYAIVFEHGYEAHKRLINTIKTVYPGIEDIRLFSERVGPEIIYKHGKVPFFAMGDGFKFAYIYLTHLLILENGYILCEEPENYQHPSSRKLIVKGIVESAKRNQIFISTHSLELIDDLLVEAKDIDIKFFVPSLDENGILTYYSFNKEEAEFRRKELEADLRD